MKTATIILLGSISCLVGCDSKTCPDRDVSNPPSKPGCFVSTNIVDIKENIRLMCDSLGKTGASAGFFSLASNLYNSLTSVTDATIAVMLCDARLDALFEVDFSHFSYKEQARIDELIRRNVDQAFGYLKGVKLPRDQWHELCFEKEIEYEVKYLKWKRHRIKCLRPKQRLQKAPTPAEVGEDAYNEWLIWRDLYYDGMDEYEHRLRNIERMFSCRTRGVSSNTVARVRAMVEEYIGRPIRTEAQCREDFRLKRHVEYFEKKDPYAAP